MKTYILYDGANEVGPLTVEEIKLLNISRTTPVRLVESDRWTTPDKIAALRPLVVPKRPIRRAADVIPVMRDRVTDLHYQRPNVLYGGLLAIALFTSIGIYSSKYIFHSGKLDAQHQAQLAAANASAGGEIIMPSHAAGKTAGKAGIKRPAATAPENWRELITVQQSNYGYGVLGGISNLQVVASNKTEYMVDEIVAKLTYIKANGKVWKTKLVSVKSVKPGTKKSVDVENVIRSKKVKVQLYRVRCVAMNLNYAGK